MFFFFLLRLTALSPGSFYIINHLCGLCFPFFLFLHFLFFGSVHKKRQIKIHASLAASYHGKYQKQPHTGQYFPVSRFFPESQKHPSRTSFALPAAEQSVPARLIFPGRAIGIICGEEGLHARITCALDTSSYFSLSRAMFIPSATMKLTCFMTASMSLLVTYML